MHRLHFVLIAIVGLAAFPKSIVAAEPPVVQAINDAMQSHLERPEASGIVTLVARDGKIVHLGSVGYRDIESAQEMNTSTVFAIASMSKPITATALMILVDEGKVSIDDPVSKYIPSFANAKLKSGDAPQREVTLKDCLTHTSGLAGSQLFETSLKEVAEELAQRPLEFQPGTEWKYSPGLNVIGRVVEIVSEQPFDVFLKERIFEPLQMNDTTFYPNEKQVKRVATIYGPNEDKTDLIPQDNFITKLTTDTPPNPSGGLVSTASDLFRFYQMALNGGQLDGKRIVSQESVKLMTSSHTGHLKAGFTPGSRWGLGWGIVTEPEGVTAAISAGTFGHGGAFGTQGWVDPKTKTIYVLLVQRRNLGGSDRSELRGDFHKVAVEALGI